MPSCTSRTVRQTADGKKRLPKRFPLDHNLTTIIGGRRQPRLFAAVGRTRTIGLEQRRRTGLNTSERGRNRAVPNSRNWVSMWMLISTTPGLLTNFLCGKRRVTRQHVSIS